MENLNNNINNTNGKNNTNNMDIQSEFSRGDLRYLSYIYFYNINYKNILSLV